MFVKSTRFKQVCQLLLSLIVAKNKASCFQCVSGLLRLYLVKIVLVKTQPVTCWLVCSFIDASSRS